MKILFAATPALAVPCLRFLADHFNVGAVLTNPDRCAGRRRQLTASPVKQAALALQLPLFQPAVLSQEVISSIRAQNFDLLVVFAYGKIFKTEFLELFPAGAINVHPSALPRYRGPSPLNAAILAGDSSYGISIQKIAAKMDSGDLLLQRSYPLSSTASAATLAATVAQQVPELLGEVLANWQHLQPQPQDDSQASYCKLLRSADGQFNWTLSAIELERQLRAYQPWPGSFSFLPIGGKLQRCNFFAAGVVDSGDYNLAKTPQNGTIVALSEHDGIVCQTGAGLLGLTTIQRQCGKVLPAAEFARGLPALVGTAFCEDYREK